MKFFAASLNENLPEIDLHRCNNIPEAIELLHKELFLFSKNGDDVVRVIYGIGEGKMRGAVLEELEKNPMVADVKEEEGGGRAIVLL